MRIKRKRTKEVGVGKLILGGNNPVRVQSMCDIRTRNAEETIKQISQLEEAGCEIVRIAIPDMESEKKT
ncbi:flavodoxin-dependent (E)-4-hydroxy-3-methylbut-2-enyl-diphosphate synthase [Candidatus Pacearchaeota archaeon]|nr:flavodoxin-dependent (E)-4-hydroxy-3-methylbut-2-enyl-diphosphate synthase [Candidatus Pacearchaeota archaeon]